MAVVKEPRYVPIYCTVTAVLQSKHTHDHREQLGRCFAQKVDGRWRCCCCGTPVKVSW